MGPCLSQRPSPVKQNVVEADRSILKYIFLYIILYCFSSFTSLTSAAMSVSIGLEVQGGIENVVYILKKKTYPQ